MPPSTKEPETLTQKPENGARSVSAASGEPAPRQQAVALEIPVAVNGVRPVGGGDKREPFSETTKTVLVFGRGAVIRLASAMAPGQLLFLTNERTKKEVVCQVVKSKNYRNVSGYVELEFTEPAVGFWGMRFPEDRIAPASQPAPAAQAPVVKNIEPKGEETKSIAPAAPVTPKPAPPASPVSAIVPPALDSASLPGSSSAKPKEAPAARDFDAPRVSERPASIFEPSPQTSSSNVTVDLSSLTPFFEVKPASSGSILPPQAPAPASSDPETDELKQHTARLQEELASLSFSEPAPSSPKSVSAAEPSFPPVEKDQVHEKPAQLLETSKAPLPAPILADLIEPAEPGEPAKITPAKPALSLEALEQEELKIPAWLEPLARNAAAPSSTRELLLREKSKRVTEQPKPPKNATEPMALAEEGQVPEVRAPEFGSALPMDEMKKRGDRPAKKSGNGMMFAALAAGIVLAAGGGWWYMNQRSGVHTGVPDSQTQAASAPAPVVETEGVLQPAPSKQTGPAAAQASPVKSDSAAPNHPEANPSSVPSESSPATPSRGPQPSANSAGSGKVVALSSSMPPLLTPAEEKKPVLGDVHLARPKVSQKQAQTGGEPDAGVWQDDAPAQADALNTGIAVGDKEPAAPAAPLPVGGDVKQAKLISSVPPAYPTLAKAQHVSGNVTVDALIDVNGRVTTMKVVSGPTLLHQAAMDALKQWKYQPASLDGKPVPMHLTVTIQFHLQ